MLGLARAQGDNRSGNERQGVCVDSEGDAVTITTEQAHRLMHRCQVGVGGKNAMNDAHDIMAECFCAIGALVAERDDLLSEYCHGELSKRQYEQQRLL
jgi:hypothetical protein